MKKGLFGVVLVVVILLASCYSVTFEGLQMQKDMPDYTVIKDFKRTIRDAGFLGNPGGYRLITFGQPDKVIFETIRSEINKVSGDAAIDVSIKYGASIGDILFGGVLPFLLASSHITITGTIVKIND